MKYEIDYSIQDGVLKSVVSKAVPMRAYEALELAEKAIRTAIRDQYDFPDKFKLEDGRTRWMVTYDKYRRLQMRNRELKEELAKLKQNIGNEDRKLRD